MTDKSDTTNTVWTLAEWEDNGYNDSDFYARLYDDATGEVTTKMVGTTRGAWSDTNRSSSKYPKVTTAPADVADRARKAVADAEAAAYKALITFDAEKAVTEPAMGRRVRVTRGRKVPPGTEGTVAWVGVDKFKSGRWATFWRLGLDLDDGSRVFVNDEYVIPIDGLTVDRAAIDKAADEVRDSVLADPKWYRRNGVRGFVPGFSRPSPSEKQRYLTAEKVMA